MSARLYAARHLDRSPVVVTAASIPAQGPEAESPSRTRSHGHLTLVADINETPPATLTRPGGSTNRNSGGFDVQPKHAA